MVVVFGGVFLVLFSGTLGFTLMQLRQSRQKAAFQKALVIAEAGVNYYRWHLAHAPLDLQDGQAWCCAEPPCAACGPYEHTYSDPEGGAIGVFSLEIEGAQHCGQTSAITIQAAGWTNDFPNTKRTVQVKYVRPTVADYAYLLNDNVWAGSDREIKGPYHSNGGIRMDGENKSTVTSARDEWVCTESFGCDPCPDVCRIDGSNCVCPGVFTTANGQEELFDFPVPPFDFDGITMDLAQIKALAQGGQGLYFAPSGDEGYHFVLKNNRTVDVYRVTSLESLYAYNTEDDWHWEDSAIQTENFMDNYIVPEDCSVIFVEDDLWLEGEWNDKLTIVSADLISPTEETDIWLTGNVEYTIRDNSDGLTVMSQHNILIGLDVPDRLELHGVYIAQNGRFGRNHYPCSWYSPECKRDYLEIFGTVVSNGRVGTKWMSGTSWISGYERRENIYDPDMSFDPCPFLPAISLDYEFKEWEELE